MKKYVKPDLYYENFELSAHVAACGRKVVMHSGNKHTCYGTVPDWGNMVVFTTSTCGIDDFDGDEEDYCYTNGAGSSFLFRS